MFEILTVECMNFIDQIRILRNVFLMHFFQISLEEVSFDSKGYPELTRFSFPDNWLVTFALIKDRKVKNCSSLIKM